MNAYREHLKAEQSAPSVLDMVVAVMCDENPRTVPAIIRAIQEMNVQTVKYIDIHHALLRVRDRGWGVMRIFGGGSTEYKLVKA